MGLETGTLIPDLVDANPAGTDPKSQGDDHLRLIKTCVQGSFAAFVGTTAVPKSVALTEDQINDAALQSETALISGDWSFLAPVLFQDTVGLSAGAIMDNDAQLTGLDTLAAARLLAMVDSADTARFGDPAINAVVEALSKSSLVIGGIGSADVVDLATGAFTVADISGVMHKAGFRNPSTTVLAAGAVSLEQSQEGQIVESATASRNISVPVLEIDTTITLTLREVTGNVLVAAGVTLNWADGSGAFVTGDRTMSGANVVQLQWRTATDVLLWGNGIS